MVSKLANETLQQIFSYIEDANVLYSIIQVNHNWCENGIKFLWSNPFRDDIDIINHTKILPVLIPFLRKDKLLDIKNGNNTMVYHIGLFDYPRFITHLDYGSCFRIVLKYFETNKDDFECFMDFIDKQYFEKSEISILQIMSDDLELRKILVITLIILTVISHGTPKISWLKIDIKYNDIKRFLDVTDEDSEEDEDTDDDERIEVSEIKRRYRIIINIESSFSCFLNTDDVKALFVNLKYLELGKLTIKLSILEILSTSCTQLKTIKIEERYFQLIREPLVTLIKNQNHLENLRISGIANSLKLDYEATIFEIFSSLELVARSLKKIKIRGILVTNDETFKFFDKCRNLENLSLDTTYVTFKNLERISLAELPKLCTLKLFDICSDEDDVKKSNPIQAIFQNKKISLNLRELILLNESIENHNLLGSIGENYKNLSFFSTQITADSDIPYIFTILNNSPKLEELRLVIPLPYISNVNTGFITELVKVLPDRINAINFFNLICCLDEYRYFLENCMVNLKYFHVDFSVDINNYDEFVEFAKIWSKKKGKEIKNFLESRRKLYVTWE
ncbi:hypothetical protein C1645_773886 [Glomus cerebriforme]|uniref:F-box domain-containing protein n=1 Tax=Glomus cerebriforme TaxID=658196 RepID=A0A397SRR4_9GLOM|nr:hypothetical protein C1645_773886 [Glomus cerebriforme]